MAYIPKDDENEQSGMNVLAPQQGQSGTNQTGSDSGSQAGSGAESSTIGGGAGMGAQKAPRQSKAGTKSGMFTNLRKYIDQNKAGASNIANKMKSTASQENASIQQAISKQKTDFMSRVQANRARMTEAQAFGQDTLQSAQTQQDAEYNQQNLQNTQGRIDDIGVIDNQQVTGYQDYLQSNTEAPQDFGAYSHTQLGIDPQQAAYAQAQEKARAAQQQYKEYVDQFGGDQAQIKIGEHTQRGQYRYDDRQVDDIQDMANYRERLMGITDREQIRNDRGIEFWNYKDSLNIEGEGALGNLDYQKERLANELPEAIDKINQNYNLLEDEKRQKIQELNDHYNNQINNIDSIITSYGERESAFNEEYSQLDKLTGLKDQYDRAQEQQRMFENKGILQDELAVIQDKIDTAPDQLTEDDITRFNQLRTGIERFDNAVLNVASEDRRTEQSLKDAEGLTTNQGRRDMLRKEFGTRGQYSSGQASLDNLILTSDQEVTRDLIQESKANAEQSKQLLQDAYNTGRISIAELKQGTEKVQRDLSEGVIAAESGLRTNLEERAAAGEGTYMKELTDRIQSGRGMTDEDRALLELTGEERYNLDPATLLSQIDPTQYNIQDVANLTDVARAKALARLSGQDEQRMLLNEQEIRNRDLVNEGDEFATTFDELNRTDRESLMEFKDKLRGDKRYENIDAARGELKSNLATNYGNAGIIAPKMQDLVENGSIGTNQGTFTLEQIMSGDKRAFRALADLVYWDNVSKKGQHGANTDPETLRRMVLAAVDGSKAIADTYKGKQSNALRKETKSGYEDTDKALKKLGLE